MISTSSKDERKEVPSAKIRILLECSERHGVRPRDAIRGCMLLGFDVLQLLASGEIHQKSERGVCIVDAGSKR